MGTTNEEDWIQSEHRYRWFEPISWDDFLLFVGGDPNNPEWPGKDSDKNPLKYEPGQTSERKWQEWWKFYWSWQNKINGKSLPDNLPDWAKPDENPLTDEDIKYWMKHWKSFVSRHWHAWEEHGRPRPIKNNASVEYNAIIAWGADPECPPSYV